MSPRHKPVGHLIDGPLEEVVGDWLFHTTTAHRGRAGDIAKSETLIPGTSEGFVSLSSKPQMEFGNVVLVFRKRSVSSRLMRVQYTENWMMAYPEHAEYVANDESNWGDDVVRWVAAGKPRTGWFVGLHPAIEKQEIIGLDRRWKFYVDDFKKMSSEAEWITRNAGQRFPFAKGELAAVLCNNGCHPSDIAGIRKSFKKLLPPHYVQPFDIGMKLIRSGEPLDPEEVDPPRGAVFQTQPSHRLKQALAASSPVMSNLDERAGQWLFHTTSAQSVTKIVKEKRVSGRPYASFSLQPVLPFNTNGPGIAGADAVLVFKWNAGMERQLSPVEYTFEWAKDNPERAAYVVGFDLEGQTMQFTIDRQADDMARAEGITKDDEDDYYDFVNDSGVRAEAAALALTPMLKGNKSEREWISDDEFEDAVKFKIDDLDRILVRFPNQLAKIRRELKGVFPPERIVSLSQQRQRETSRSV